MKRRKGFYEAEPLASSIARRDWQHTLERAEESGLPLQSRKGNTGLLFPARILAPVWEEGLRHIILAAIRYSMGRHTYMPSIAVDFTCRNLSCLDEHPFRRCGGDSISSEPIWRTGAISPAVEQSQPTAHI